MDRRADAVSSVIDFRVRVPIELCPPNSAPPANVERYDAVLGTTSKVLAAPSLDDLLSQMDANGVAHAVMHAEYESGDPVDDLNQAVAEVVTTYPHRFTGIGTVSLAELDIKRALNQVEQCSEMGMIGLSIQPAFFGMEIADKRLYPIYAKAADRDLLVALHTGINYATNRPMKGEHPMQIDEVCCDFNDLVVVASHAGWPWATELAAVARRHPNVFLEFGGLAPKYVSQAGSGWEVMFRFMNSLLARQVLFGTDWPVMDHARAISEWREAELKSSVLRGLLAGNAERLLATAGSAGFRAPAGATDAHPSRGFHA